ncbi:MAG: 5-formyltetrahydrofolate cyclo-ligase [Candidatus Lokiarchaeota archaeon]|nr:5-formyltetrahydrofolate cyclo-ligase [Candidatus Harpocratesius repetitus]
METPLDPAELRKKILKKRKELPPVIRMQKFAKIMKKFFKLYDYQQSDSIIGYFGKVESGEFDTRPLLTQILNDGKALFLPRCVNERIALDIYRINDIVNDVELGAYGIMEPKFTCQKINPNKYLSNIHKKSLIILVPGSVFDIYGARYGYGAGYYDSFLTNKEILKIAFALDNAVMKYPIPTHEKDVYMDIIITEKQIYRPNG